MNIIPITLLNINTMASRLVFVVEIEGETAVAMVTRAVLCNQLKPGLK